MSELSVPTNLYDEALIKETVCDLSSSGLDIIPNVDNKLLTALYLQNNQISTIPDDFFPSLPSLMWLDLRDNRLTAIPKSIQNHPRLTHLLLQNNKLTSLPDELGTVNLKVLQLNGNPITYPPKEILNGGVPKILTFLNNKFVDKMFVQSQTDLSEDGQSFRTFDSTSQGVVSYNSVLDRSKIKENQLSIKLNEKDTDSDEEYYEKIKGKCPKLAKSRYKTLSPFCQSSKYVAPPCADNKATANFKIKQSYLKDLAIKKHKDLLAKRDKILQDRKNIQMLQNWRREYRIKQHTADGSYRLEPKSYPYDISPEYMTLLTRDDIEKDLPDKYRKRLVRRCKPSVPRKTNSDVHLAIKIKQLFENLEAIDLNRKDMTPRTEQKVLLNEIQKAANEQTDRLMVSDERRPWTLAAPEDINFKCKPSVPRKTNSDVHLAIKIKQLFENLEAIDLNRKDMTPRTEQKVLLNEIQKISEIKQKLMELSTSNTRSVVQD